MRKGFIQRHRNISPLQLFLLFFTFYVKIIQIIVSIRCVLFVYLRLSLCSIFFSVSFMLSFFIFALMSLFVSHFCLLLSVTFCFSLFQCPALSPTLSLILYLLFSPSPSCCLLISASPPPFFFISICLFKISLSVFQCPSLSFCLYLAFVSILSSFSSLFLSIFFSISFFNIQSYFL